MDVQLQKLQVDLLLHKLQQFCERYAVECYLVGGSLRDLLRGHPPQDLDLAARGNVESIARVLAIFLKGHVIPLNETKGVQRVILPKKPYGRIFIDLAPLHDVSIADDLAQRDFTVNAMALPVAAAVNVAMLSAQPEQPPAALIDPLNGWHDLRDGLLRAGKDGCFQKDARRLLRAIRLSAGHHLTIEPTTASIMHRDSPLLQQTDPARIRDELLQMLELPLVSTAVPALGAYHLLSAIFPGVAASDNSASLAARPEPGTVAWHTLNAITIILAAGQGMPDTLTEAEQALLAPLLRLSHRRAFKKRWKPASARFCAHSTLLLLAALLSDLLPEGMLSGALPAEQAHAIAAALKRLAIGRQDVALVVLLLQQNAVPWEVEARPTASSREPWRAARFYFERFGEQGIELAALCLARQIAALQGSPPDDAWRAQAETVLNLIVGYYEERNVLIPNPLLDGEVLMTRLGLTKGPLIGALLAKARQAQLEGLIQTRAEALQLLSEEGGISGLPGAAKAGDALPAGHSSQQQNAAQKQAGE